MIGIGGATDFSLRRQEADGKNGDISFVHTVMLGSIAAALFLLIGIFLAEPLGRILGADATTLPYTKVYLQTILCFAPAFLLNNILLAFVRNDMLFEIKEYLLLPLLHRIFLYLQNLPT